MFKFFESRIDPFPDEQPIQPPNTLVAFCRHYTQGLEKYLLLMSVLTATLAVSEALLYGILGEMVDWFALQDKTTFLTSNTPMLLMMAAFILLFIPVIVWLHSVVVHQGLMGNFPMRVRWQAHRYLLHQSLGFFNNEFSGRVATKVMQTSLSVRESVMKVLDVMLFVMVYLITTITLVGQSSWQLSLPILAWLVCYVLTLRFFIPRLRDISMHQADARSDMTGRVVDSYSNILTLKLFSRHQRESDYVREGMDNFLQTVHPQMRLVTWLNFSVWFLNMLLIFATASLGIYLWLGDLLTPGAIAIAMSLAIRITGMSHWIMWEVSNLFEQIGVVADGMQTLSQPTNSKDKPDATALQFDQAAVKFEAVSFSYQADNSLFNGFDLSIAAGEKVGIVGRSGSGKSTLLNLLLRFYDVQQGKICIDGQNIADVQQESLREHIAMVTQDTSLLHRSVKDNILFGKTNATEAQMLKAAKLAQAHDFILELEDSHGRKAYDAHVGERGVTLSGGQRQRIAIARVLLKDAPILLLDEATSALDSEVESAIQQNLYLMMQGKTVIAIAHRLSTIAAMDRLLVLDDGEIVEQGTHQELLALNGLYAQLWQHQSGGFLVNT